jgi:hypothetical protein
VIYLGFGGWHIWREQECFDFSARNTMYTSGKKKLCITKKSIKDQYQNKI